MYTMLVAVDGSEHAENAVRYALDMARRLGEARILLLNVQPPAMSGEVSNLLTAEEVMDQHTEAGRRVLESAQALVDQAGVANDTEIAIGRPAESIVECAHRRGCDAIVMGASSHGRVHSLVLGSVASKVAHMAEVPVTVVK
ncbi:MAG: universal stress protein [Burkholderiales bacterium]|nr:universal stress protein [Burkholderiales bacterium]